MGDAADRALFITQIGNLTRRAKVNARGERLEPALARLPHQPDRSAIHPALSQFNTSINPTVAPLGKSWYDALQITVTKRYSHGLTVNGNYTYSKNLDLISSPDIFNRNSGKNISANDLPQQFRLSAEYHTPRAPKGMAVIGNPIVSFMLADWGLGVYAQYQSAPLLGRPAAGSVQPISDWLGRGPGGAQLKTRAGRQSNEPLRSQLGRSQRQGSRRTAGRELPLLRPHEDRGSQSAGLGRSA